MDNHLFPLKEIVCVKTLYNYVDSMLLRLRNIDLPLKVRIRRTTRSIKKNLKHMGRSIDERDSNVDERNEFGHWEIDTVIGSKSKSDNVVLTLVERITRKYIALKITSKTSIAVNEGIAYLKEYYVTKFSQVFKTITSDNGSKFAELSQIENDTSIKIYWERGINERHNGLLRRFIRKGKRMDNYSCEDIMFIADWCNSLSRKILGYKTPDELFDFELDKIYAS